MFNLFTTTALDDSVCLSLSTGMADNWISLPSGIRKITWTDVGVAALFCPDEATFSLITLPDIPVSNVVKPLFDTPESTTTEL